MRIAGGAVPRRRDGGGAYALCGVRRWGAEHAGWSDGTAGVVGKNQARHIAEGAGRHQLGLALVGDAVVIGNPPLGPMLVLSRRSAGDGVGGQPDTGKRPRER